MSSFLQDLRYAVRMLQKNPAFTAVAVLTLAVGIGATSAVFDLIHGVLLTRPPLPESRAYPTYLAVETRWPA